MSEVEKAVRARLVEIAEVAALVGQKVYANTAPQNAQLPYVVFTVRGEGRDVRGGLVNALVDVECRGASYGEAKSLAEAARRIDRWHGTAAGVNVRGVFVEDVSDVYEPPVHGAELGHFAKNLSLRAFVIETTFNG